MASQITIKISQEINEYGFLEKEFNQIAELYSMYLKENDFIFPECRIILNKDWKDFTNFYSNRINMISLNENFDFDHYEKIKGSSKRKMILSAIHSALLKIAKVENWPTKMFKAAYHFVYEQLFIVMKPL